MLRDLGDPADAARRRDRTLTVAERTVEDATSRAVRAFLRRCLAAVSPDALTAAGGVEDVWQLFTLGQAAGWWQDAVDRHVVDEVRSVWRRGYLDTRDGELLATSAGRMDRYLAQVTDRLSRTATPTIPEQAFDRARVALADELARGSSNRVTAARLGAEFGWDSGGRFWQTRYADLTAELDAILDPLGPPGAADRESARLGNQRVATLQRQRSDARLAMDRDESVWMHRATRIARTETTGAYNAGSLSAMLDEDAGFKVWLATGDDRTRDTHLAASGQCVPVGDPFRVGSSELMMPADPSGPAEETVMCRCTMVAARSCGDVAGRFGRSADVIEAERARRS